MPRLPISLPLTRQVGQTTYPHAERLTGLVVAAALAASIALVFTGCSTPVLKPSVDVPAKLRREHGLRDRSPRPPGGKASATRC